MLVNVVYKPALILAHPEEVVLLLNDPRFVHMNRAPALRQFRIRVKPLTSDTVFPLIITEVYVPLFVDLGEDLPHCGFMIPVSSTDEVVVRDIKLGPCLFKGTAYPVHICLDCLTRSLSGLNHLVAMFIRTR